MRHWEPRLLTHSVALQNALVQRLVCLDPMAADWLTGISWQLALQDESRCPGMPPRHTWTGAGPTAPPAQTPERDVETARADLNRLLARRDEPHWAPTQPWDP
jgi:hypothetical protein